MPRLPLRAPSPIARNYLLYVDESGVPEAHPSQTSHYVLAGLAIPASKWADYHDDIETLKLAWGIVGSEIHVAWLVRPYTEQLRITGFDSLEWSRRRPAVLAERAKVTATIEAQGHSGLKRLRNTEKFNRKTAPYVHLTLEERKQLAIDVVGLIAGWPDVVLFGDVVDKRIGVRTGPDVEAFEQVMTRFQAFLGRSDGVGIVAYDHNEAQVPRVIARMAVFQRTGGMWRKMDRIVGHPFFVGSQTSSLIQAADVLAYALRRYVEKDERALFDPLLARFDRLPNRLVGLRHYRGRKRCPCIICSERR